MTSLFDKIFGRKEAEKSVQRTIKLSEPYQFFQIGGTVVWRNTSSSDGIIEALEQCPIITTIINKEVEAFGRAENSIVYESSGKPARGEQKKYEQVLDNPNPLQTRAQFEAQVMAYTISYGYCPVLYSKPVGFDIEQIWVLPPNFCEIRRKRNVNITKVRKNADWIDVLLFGAGQNKTPVDLNRLYIYTDTTVSTSDIYLPQSRLAPLSKPITTLLAYYNAEAEMMLHRGPRGILANKAAGDLDREPIGKDERDRIQTDFKEAYGLQPTQSQIIITDAALEWQSMSFNAEELGLEGTYKRAVFDIATGLSYPKDLLQLEGSTFNNQNAALKSLYSEMVIPFAKSYCEQTGELLGLRNAGLRYVKSYDHLEVMQQSEKERGDGIKAMTEAVEMQFNLNAITYNEMMKLLELPPRSGMDLYKYQLTEIYGQNTNQGGGGAGNPTEAK